jgi:hypothetical protein
VRRFGLDASGSGGRPVAESCEHGNKPSTSMKGRTFFFNNCEC